LRALHLHQPPWPEPRREYVRSLPSMESILAAMVVTEIDDIEASRLAQKLCSCAGLCPPIPAVGHDFSKQTPATLQQIAPLDLCGGGLDSQRMFGLLRDFYRHRRVLGEANIAIFASRNVQQRN
jgi:hypothetical protein